eukprot:1681031-Amphidinium_carterae.1
MNVDLRVDLDVVLNKVWAKQLGLEGGGHRHHDSRASALFKGQCLRPHCCACVGSFGGCLGYPQAAVLWRWFVLHAEDPLVAEDDVLQGHPLCLLALAVREAKIAILQTNHGRNIHMVNKDIARMRAGNT